VRFSLFGDVRAEHDGASLDLGRRQERCVLGILLLEAGRVVPTERLADLLWDGHPPATARRVLQTYVARLRARLGAHGVKVERASGGYRVAVEPSDVDVHRFRAMIAATGGLTDCAERARVLTAALELWTGPLLGGTASAQLRARLSIAWQELRMTALEQCAQAELDCGRPERAIGVLADHALGQPIREQSVALLMRAYAAAGRTEEALATYRAARTALVDDLGLEPGPDLRRLQESILRSTAEPAGAAGSPAVSTRPAPRELPPPLGVFAGRLGERQHLADVVRQANSTSGRATTVVIHGRGGAGKSALAVQVAHDVAESFPDGQLYLNLAGSSPGLPARPMGDVLGQALRGLGVGADHIPGSVDEAAARLRSEAFGRRILIVADNVRDAAQVEPLIPASGGCAVIVTGRTMLATLDADARVALGGLDQDEARRLLTAISGRRPDPHGAIDRIIDACERLPLALRIAAARLASRPDLSLDDLADRLADRRHRLDELDLDGLAVRTTIGASVDELAGSPEELDQLAARLLPYLVVVPVSTMSAELATAAAGHPDARGVRAALDRLVDLSLLYAADGRYRMHDLVRLYAMESLRRDLSTSERDQAVGRALSHYLVTTARVQAVLMPGRPVVSGAPAPPDGLPPVELTTPEAANAWLDAELDNMIAAARFARQLTGDWVAFPLYAGRTLHWLLGKRGAWPEELALADLAVEVTTTWDCAGDHIDALRMRGQAAMHVDQLGEAKNQLGTALELAYALADPKRIHAVLTDLGLVALAAQDFGLARQRLEDGLRYAREGGLTRIESIMLLNLSDVYVGLREWDLALGALEQSLAIRRQLGDVAGMAIVLPALGYVFLELGRRPDATVYLDEGSAICRSLRNGVDGWFAEVARSVLHLTAGEIPAALHAAVAAVRFGTDARPYETAASLRLLAIVSHHAGRASVSAECHRRADAAYAAHAGPRRPPVESLLAHARSVR
jgi:DNA-binding SARP family transcriptional activator